MKIPAIRGKIGIWNYYSGVMTFNEIANNVVPSINEIYQASCLDELLQRAITGNYESIKNYIINDNERFFNSLILAVYDGDPQWFEVEFPEDQRHYTNVGFLEIEANSVDEFDPNKTTIFPVDGQHRVRGIIEALKCDPSLGNEQIPVVIVAHKQSVEGRKRTRKLFATLNRRNKPVGKNENIALDEDDICAIITRELIQEYSLFQEDRVVNDKGKQIPPTNEKAITSLIALYEIVDSIIQNKTGLKGKGYAEFKLYRPCEDVINELLEYVFKVMDSFSTNITVVKDYMSDGGEKPASKYRNASGGSIIFRPMAITEIFNAATRIVEKKECSLDDAFTLINDVPLELSMVPWKDFLWDGEKIIPGASHVLIRNLLLYLIDEKLLEDKELEKMYIDYAKILKRSDDEVRELLKK